MSETERSQPARGSPVKTALVFFGIGAFVALLGVALVFPRLILWYFEPPIVNGWGSCGPSVNWAIQVYQRVELGGWLLGGLGGLWVSFRFGSRRSSSGKGS